MSRERRRFSPIHPIWSAECLRLWTDEEAQGRQRISFGVPRMDGNLYAPAGCRNGNSYVTCLMTGLSHFVKRCVDCREVLFWLLLLGSWQFLVAPGRRNTLFGAAGTATFLVFAWRNLGRLEGLGLAHAGWQPTTRARWLVAAVSGLVAGATVFGIGSARGQDMMLSDDWGLAVLQVTLGPVLEEVVFRGYLFALLTWSLRKAANGPMLNGLVVAASAAVFALAHAAQTGVGWLQLSCIASTGLLYGSIRRCSGSTAPAAVSHACYNLTLYAAAGILAAARSGNAI